MEPGRRVPRAGRPADGGVMADERIPEDVSSGLGKGSARAAFDALPPSHRREYLTWINEAQRAETRARRIAQTAERLGGAKDH